MVIMLLERGVITEEEIDKELEEDHVSSTSPVFKEGDKVRIRRETSRICYRRPHLRVPGYVYGLSGTVKKLVGTFHDPFLLAFRKEGPKQHLYSVSIPLSTISTYSSSEQNDTQDEIELDVYQNWLEPTAVNDLVNDALSSSSSEANHHLGHTHAHAHAQTHTHTVHDHHHDHDHEKSTNKKATYSSDTAHSHGEHVPEHGHDQEGQRKRQRQEQGHAQDHGHDHHHEERAVVELNAVEKEGETPPGQVVGEGK